MISSPKFSVIIPVHNKFPHLERSVMSVLNQTNSDLELILIDDASSDGSSEKIKEFKDNRIKLLRRDTPGPGGYAARNLGIANAAADWVCFLDADDEWELYVLETLSEVIQNNPQVEILCWGWTKVNGKVKLLDAYTKRFSGEKIKSFTLTDFFNGPQPMWTGGISMRKDLIQKAGVFPEVGFKRGGDMDTWIRSLWHSKKSIRIIRSMTYYNLDSVNMVTKAIERNTSYTFSDFVMNILHTTEDKELAKAIRNFQSRHIYSILSERVGLGGSIDYSLLSRMKPNMASLFLIGKLHLKKALVTTKLFKGK